jgi:DNA-binding MarR family transcriptional regulator
VVSERRQELLSSIQRAMADAQGQGAIFGNAVAERLGLSSTELETLGMLDAHGALTAGTIATRTGLTTGAVTRLIDRLVAGGWVERRADRGDRRRVLIELTADARRRSAPFYSPMARAAREALARYNERELTLILEFLERMREVAAQQTSRVLAMSEPLPSRRRVNLKARVFGQKVRIRF